MFERVGRRIDDILINTVRKTRTIIYPMGIAYLFTKRRIKRQDFEDYNHFVRYMTICTEWKYINERQAKRLVKLYRKHHTERIDTSNE